MWALAVWVYRRQKAHLDSGRIGAAGFGPVSQTAAVIERLRLGCPSTKRNAVSRTHVDDDAITVHEMVLRMQAHERALIVDHAVLGSPPDWDLRLPPVQVVPVLRGNGKPKMLYPPRRHEPIACLIDYKGVLPQQAMGLRDRARQRYSDWYAALAILMDALARLGELMRWNLIGVGPRREPWLQNIGDSPEPANPVVTRSNPAVAVNDQETMPSQRAREL
jgi:hypothetical protein